MKVRIFLENIQDARLISAVRIVDSNEDLSRSFETAKAFIMKYALKDEAKDTRTRSLAAFDRGGRGPGGRFGDRGGGRGGGRNGGRGGGRRETRNEDGPLFDQAKPHCNYTSAEWSQLTEDQKAKVRAARNAYKSNTKRNLSAVNQRVTFNEPEAEAAGQEEEATSTGDQMNRRGGKKRKE
jgi:hypothetical protein